MSFTSEALQNDCYTDDSGDTTVGNTTAKWASKMKQTEVLKPKIITQKQKKEK